MPGGGQPGIADRASVCCVLLGGQQMKGKHEGVRKKGQRLRGCDGEAETRETEYRPSDHAQTERQRFTERSSESETEIE